jgi:hypothetical protein
LKFCVKKDEDIALSFINLVARGWCEEKIILDDQNKLNKTSINNNNKNEKTNKIGFKNLMMINKSSTENTKYNIIKKSKNLDPPDLTGKIETRKIELILSPRPKDILSPKTKQILSPRPKQVLSPKPKQVISLQNKNQNSKLVNTSSAVNSSILPGISTCVDNAVNIAESFAHLIPLSRLLKYLLDCIYFIFFLKSI